MLGLLKETAVALTKGHDALGDIEWRDLLAMLIMTACLSCHFFGNEFARAAAFTLFTDIYGAGVGLPAYLSFVPLFALGLIGIYNVSIQSFGPRNTLIASMLGIAGTYRLCVTFTNVPQVIAFLFVFREAQVTFLTSQMWSFLGSICSGKDQARRLFGPITGGVSLMQGLGGWAVGNLAHSYSTDFLMNVSMVFLVAGALLAHQAYMIASSSKRLGKAKTTKDNALPSCSSPKRGGFLISGWRSLSSSPILQPLFFCTFSMQAVATLLNLAFQSYLSELESSERSAWVGNFHAVASLSSAVVQFWGLGWILSRLPTGLLLYSLPVLMCVFIILASIWQSLGVAAFTYWLFKLLEYGVFNATKEMLFVPLSYEARHVSKEYIDVVAYRFGKGAACAVASIALVVCAPSPRLNMALALVGAGGWLLSCHRLDLSHSKSGKSEQLEPKVLFQEV